MATSKLSQINTCDFYSVGAQFESWPGYNYLLHFHGFPHSFYAHASPVRQAVMASFMSFPFHYSLIILRGGLGYVHIGTPTQFSRSNQLSLWPLFVTASFCVVTLRSLVGDISVWDLHATTIFGTVTSSEGSRISVPTC